MGIRFQHVYLSSFVYLRAVKSTEYTIHHHVKWKVLGIPKSLIKWVSIQSKTRCNELLLKQKITKTNIRLTVDQEYHRMTLK